MKKAFILVISLIVLLSISPTNVLATSKNPEINNFNEIHNQISEDAATLVLSLDDFEPGWTLLKQQEVIIENTLSAYHVYFYKGTISPPVIQNTVAVYSNEDFAKEGYLKEKPTNVSLDYPDIGDECFLDISVEINKLLVFRIENVVVQIKLQQDYFEDIEKYGRIVEQKVDRFVTKEVPPPAPAAPAPPVVIKEVTPPVIEIPAVPAPPTLVPAVPQPPSPIAPGYIWTIIILGLLGIAFYFIPSIIAFARHKSNKLAIFLLNLLVGWTFIGWVVALVWSVKHD